MLTGSASPIVLKALGYQTALACA
ncbi:hypothetical protein IL54_4155 [Sphingobium sp. ba1]|nr:hypothetical protein IL54_4155 [Sphingobium sp. ba1]